MKLLGHKVLFPLQTQVNPPQFSRTLGVCSLDRTNQKQYCLGDTHYGQGSKKNGLQRKKKMGRKEENEWHQSTDAHEKHQEENGANEQCFENTEGKIMFSQSDAQKIIQQA